MSLLQVHTTHKTRRTMTPNSEKENRRLATKSITDTNLLPYTHLLTGPQRSYARIVADGPVLHERMKRAEEPSI